MVTPFLQRDVEENYEEAEIRQRLVDELGFPTIFGRIPWGQHVEIFTKCKTLEEALFYVKETAANNWSRPALEAEIKFGRYEKQGAAITNFDATLPAPDSKMAKELLKSEYNLSFISEKDVSKEKDLEEALARNVTRFLLELGKGFACRTTHLQDGQENYRGMVAARHQQTIRRSHLPVAGSGGTDYSRN